MQLPTTFAAPQLQIYVGTTFFKFRASKRGLIGPGFSVVDYMRSTLMEREWVPRFKQYVTTYTYSMYEDSTGMAVLPRYALDSFLLYISHLKYEIIDIDPVKPKKTKFRLKPKISPRADQEELIDFMCTDSSFSPVSASCGRGKQHPVDTPIRVPNGWKPIGELQVGDPVFTQDGTITEVAAIYPQGVKPLYRVTFEDGRWVDCGGPHLWSVYIHSEDETAPDLPLQTFTTTDICELLKHPTRKVYVPIAEPTLDNPIDTTTLSSDCELPKEILTASPTQRRVYLHRLVKGTVFTTTDKTLALQIQELGRSLGDIVYFVDAGPGLYEVRFTTGTTGAPHPKELRIISIEKIYQCKECVCIAVKHPSHLYITKDYIVTHNTFCSIYSIFKNSTPAMVVVSGLGEQWYKEFHHFLKLSSDDVYVIQGFDTLKLLWEGIRKGYRPKVLIFSTRTLVLYACNPTPPYSEIPSYPELQQRLGIGIKIIDECHLNFHANVMIDLMSNVKKNIYLSATYSRSSIMGNKIFNMVYPRDMVYGEAVAHKYTVVHMIRYHLDIPSDEHDKFKVAKGYLHALYEKYLLRRKSYYRVFLEQVLIPCIRMYYLHCRKEKQKALILCQTKDFTIALQDEIQKEIKFLKVAAFLSKDPKYGKTENFEADIIVSTIKSSGTGRDIKGLKTCINTVSFASAPQAAQVMGRPREIKGEDTIYIDLWNGEISTHYHHQRRRMEAYRPRAKTIDETTIN